MKMDRKATETQEKVRRIVLGAVLQERRRQVSLYGMNDDLQLGFGGSMSDHPWLFPYTADPNGLVEHIFRKDYDQYSVRCGRPTWMHLIREEVSELFTATDKANMIEEAVQVAALCVSLVEHIILMEKTRTMWSLQMRNFLMGPLTDEEWSAVQEALVKGGLRETIDRIIQTREAN